MSDGSSDVCSTDLYAVTHVIGTEKLRRLAAILPFPVVTVRLAPVYGPGQSEDFLIPAMIRRCLEGQPLTVRHPDDRRDLLHIDDAVHGLMQLSAHKLMGHTDVNLSTGDAPRLRAPATQARAEERRAAKEWVRTCKPR